MAVKHPLNSGFIVERKKVFIQRMPTLLGGPSHSLWGIQNLKQT